MKIKITTLKNIVRRFRLQLLIIASVFGFVVILLAILVFIVPKTINLSFAASRTCATNPVLLPNLLKVDANDDYKLSRPAKLKVFNKPLLSWQVCAEPMAAPKADTVYKSSESLRLAGLKLKTNVIIKTGSLPKLAAKPLTEPIALKSKLKFNVDTPDTTFSYVLQSEAKTSECESASSSVDCDLKALQLGYGKSYEVKLVRQFKEEPVGTVATQKLTTITAAAITLSSVANGAVVYDKPQQLIFTVSKQLKAIGAVEVIIPGADGKPTVTPSKATFQGDKITVDVTEPLPRRAAISIKLASVTGADESDLETPYQLNFTTSGGPKVTGVSAGSKGLGTTQAIALTFDQVLAPGQNLNELVTLLVDGVKHPINVTVQGSRLTVSPTAAYPICAKISLQTKAELASIFGVNGDSTYSFASRAICYTTFSIGTSVQGRAITAYKFGTGASLIMYIGATHGTEQNSGVVVNRWLTELDANPDQIPAHRSVVLIPRVNPDGYLAGTRTNSRNVDLNRNFPANNWKSVVTMPGGSSGAHGGPNSLSEPESQALAGYIEAQRPRLVVSYHSSGGLVEANEAGDANTIGSLYATKAGYRSFSTSTIGTTFNYDTTGAMEDWMRDKLGLPALVIELTTKTGDDFTKNLPAMRAMAQLP